MLNPRRQRHELSPAGASGLRDQLDRPRVHHTHAGLAAGWEATAGARAGTADMLRGAKKPRTSDQRCHRRVAGDLRCSYVHVRLSERCCGSTTKRKRGKRTASTEFDITKQLLGRGSVRDHRKLLAVRREQRRYGCPVSARAGHGRDGHARDEHARLIEVDGLQQPLLVNLLFVEKALIGCSFRRKTTDTKRHDNG